MNEMTLPSGHRLRNSSPDGMRSSTFPLGSRRFSTILNIYERGGKKHFVSLKLEGQSGVRTRDLRHSKQTALTTASGLHVSTYYHSCSKTVQQQFFDICLDQVYKVIVKDYNINNIVTNVCIENHFVYRYRLCESSNHQVHLFYK